MFDAVLENDLNSESPTGKSVSDSFREIAQRNNIGQQRGILLRMSGKF